MIIAECGINYKSIEQAYTMVKTAQKCGADAVKFQLYDKTRFFPDGTVMVNGTNWYDSIPKLSWLEAKGLFKHGENIGIEVFFSVFDMERVMWCEDIGVKRYKIACRMRDPNVINIVTATQKPLIVSITTDRDPLVKTLKEHKVVYLYCVPEYPAPLGHIRLPDFKTSVFQGFSDHSIGLDACRKALKQGASMIEKHFTLDRGQAGPDQSFSLEPHELVRLVQWQKSASS